MNSCEARNRSCGNRSDDGRVRGSADLSLTAPTPFGLLFRNDESPGPGTPRHHLPVSPHSRARGFPTPWCDRRPGECGGPDIVSLQRVITKDHLSVEISPAATLRCETAEAIVDWVREDLFGLAANLESVLIGIETYDSFECRGQNRIVGAKLSEHGRANALDIRAIRLKSGRGVQLTDPAVLKDIRIAVRTSVCERFTTVLGPGADGYHEDHIHIDLAERRGGYRICQWDIYEPSPLADHVLGSTARSSVPLPRPKPVDAGATRADPRPAKSRR
jgi:hypothetical protein